MKQGGDMTGKRRGRKKETLADLTENMRAALIFCAGQGAHPYHFSSTGRWSLGTRQALVDHGLILLTRNRKGRDVWRPTKAGYAVVSADEPERRLPRPTPKWARAREFGEPMVLETLRYWRSSDVESPRFVYFIREGIEGAIKIGQAANPIKRLAEVQCGNPRELRIVSVILAGPDTELVLHNHWRPMAGIRGEWFGRGHEEAILAAATRIATAQTEAHRQKQALLDITEGVFLRALFAPQELAA